MGIMYDGYGNGITQTNQLPVRNVHCDGITVVTSDVTALAKGATKGLYIGGAGNVKVDLANGATVTLNALAVGVIHALAVTKIYATGTTATNIVALY